MVAVATVTAAAAARVAGGEVADRVDFLCIVAKHKTTRTYTWRMKKTITSPAAPHSGPPVSQTDNRTMFITYYVIHACY